MENVAGEQGLLTSNIFRTNPSNFRKIQAAIKTLSATLGGSHSATFIFLTCSFHFWHLFCTTTVLMMDKVTRPCHTKGLLLTLLLFFF